ncbi:coproporphyrinogen III oxidase [Halobacteriovorax marinus]|uniref:coproporphyrinogen oxidase n=1 Tax=Halobacteriovorax marinus TaxID=97084 RepID=A0A1Y5FDD4_9BACT|nr:coproporphyrinogen III oxidase [Halobacteriovorax marinus]
MLDKLKQNFVDHVRNLQNEITREIKRIDPSIELVEDNWDRLDFAGEKGGGGITRAFTGDIIENAGVNTSVVYGAISPEFAKKIGSDDATMWASGISLIIHPKNPKVPTTHANFRMIQAGDKFWFGGGADLTPYYPYEEDFEYFHNVWAKACEPYGNYDAFKVKCDEYFVNKHRDNEMRGIGGIFFDHLNSGNTEVDLNMVKDLSNHFIDSFFPLMDKRMDETFNEEDEDFQLHRRGRYVEFNLLHDRGTMFGLQSNGRTDSILISLPGRVKFSYKYAPKKNSPHEKMLEYYYPRDWARL